MKSLIKQVELLLKKKKKQKKLSTFQCTENKK